MPPNLALHLLGSPQLYLNNDRITIQRRKSLALLAYLSIERGQHQRDSLSGLLWPDYEQSKAFANLRNALLGIQKSVGENWIIADRESIGLNETADIWLDTAQFDSLLEKSKTESDISLRTSLLADAAKLYRNHFLTGFSLKDAYSFNDWAYVISEEHRHKLSSILTMLSNDLCSQGQADSAIPYARRLVSLDPLNETSHCLLMDIYIQAGQHSEALKQYQTLEQTLRKELNLDPQPETRELYKKIRKGDAKPVPVEKPAEKIVPKHNLPLQLSSFIGRENELKQVRSLLQKNRLVTLAGAGGIGKTSLSLQIGQNVLNAYPNGVWFITLDALSDPALITQTVASIFDMRESAERPLIERLTDMLRERTALLIFDNCEHLLEACAQLIATLLSQCPKIKALATSREELGIPGEAIYTMPALPLPEEEVDTLDKLINYESVKLFAERASLVSTSFELSDENIQTVVNICRKVDGIPLAIELAAARVNILQVDEILKQLNDSFSLLAKSGQTIMPRHQTLWTSIDWGWGLLTEAEQVFLQQLSVFAGGWTLESAQAVCQGDVLGLTDALAKKSLIVVNQESGRETRYHFHEMIRQFAFEKLITAGNEVEVRTRHLKYFLDFSEKAEIGLRGHSLVNWLEGLNDERNNLRSALRWAEKTDLEAGLFMAGRLFRFWESTDVQEGIDWCENFLQIPKSKDLAIARAQALLTHGWLLMWNQDFTRARSSADESLEIFRSANDKQGEVDALILIGNIEQFVGHLDKANEFYNQALELARKIDDPWRKANAYMYLGWDHTDYERAFSNWEKAVDLYRDVGDQINLANTLGVIGQFRILNGDIEIGERYLQEAMQVWESNKRANVWENPSHATGYIALLRGDYEKAREILNEVLVSVEQSGNRSSYLWTYTRLGYVNIYSGDLAEARTIINESVRNFFKDRYTIGVVYALEGAALLLSITEKAEYAARLLGYADIAREKIKNPRPSLEQADMDKVIATCLSKMGEEAFSDAYEDGEKMSMDDIVALALHED